MLNIATLKAGRIYSFVYTSEVEMVNKRDFNDGCGKVANPLADCLVSCRKVFRGNAATVGSYERVMKQIDPEWTPSDKPAWFEFMADGIVCHRVKREQHYFAPLRVQTLKEEYFIGGKPASEADVETVKRFKKNRGGNDAGFAVFSLDKLECQGEVDSWE